MIISVNGAWEAFATRNGGDPARTGVGVSYFEACASVPGDQAGDEAAAAIRQALAGDLPGPVSVEVPSHSPVTLRRYDMLIAPKRDIHGQLCGATVTLSLARSQPRATPDQPPVPADDTADLAAPRRREQAPVSDQDWIALADQLTGHLFRVGLSLQSARGKPQEISSEFIAEALEETETALRSLRAVTFAGTARAGQPANGQGHDLYSGLRRSRR